MDHEHDSPGSVASYTTGFVLSIIFTLAAYFAVVNELFTGYIIAFIALLAVAQLLVQLIFFLHLGREKQPRWNMITFGFMVLTLLIIVGGSLWIMRNLDYNMMLSPAEKDTYMRIQADKGF